MHTVTIWRGRRGGRRGPGSKSYFRRPRRTAFLCRKKVTFTGELIGSWSECFARRRGAEYSVYRTEIGEVIIHRVLWSGLTTANDVGAVFRFNDLDTAAARFGSVLNAAGVLH